MLTGLFDGGVSDPPPGPAQAMAASGQISLLAERLAREANVSADIGLRGMLALSPAVARGFDLALRGSTPECRSLLLTLYQICGNSLLCGLRISPSGMAEKGQAILARIFPSRFESRAAALSAARASGLEADLLARMQPTVALLIALQLIDAHLACCGVQPRDVVEALLRETAHPLDQTDRHGPGPLGQVPDATPHNVILFSQPGR